MFTDNTSEEFFLIYTYIFVCVWEGGGVLYVCVCGREGGTLCVCACACACACVCVCQCYSVNTQPLHYIYNGMKQTTKVNLHELNLHGKVFYSLVRRHLEIAMHTISNILHNFHICIKNCYHEYQQRQYFMKRIISLTLEEKTAHSTSVLNFPNFTTLYLIANWALATNFNLLLFLIQNKIFKIFFLFLTYSC